MDVVNHLLDWDAISDERKVQLIKLHTEFANSCFTIEDVENHLEVSRRTAFRIVASGRKAGVVRDGFGATKEFTKPRSYYV